MPLNKETETKVDTLLYIFIYFLLDFILKSFLTYTSRMVVSMKSELLSRCLNINSLIIGHLAGDIII